MSPEQDRFTVCRVEVTGQYLWHRFQLQRNSELKFFLDDESSDSNISSRSSDEISEDDSVESVDAAGDISVGEASQNINSSDYNVGDFIGIEYASEKKSKKIFIAQVTNTDDDETRLKVN